MSNPQNCSEYRSILRGKTPPPPTGPSPPHGGVGYAAVGPVVDARRRQHAGCNSDEGGSTTPKTQHRRRFLMIRRGSFAVVLIAALVAPGTICVASAPVNPKALVIDNSGTFEPYFRAVRGAPGLRSPMKARVLDGMKLIIWEDGSWKLIYRMEVIGRHDINVSWRLTVCNGEDVLATILTPRKHVKVTNEDGELQPISQTGQSDALRRVFKLISVRKPLNPVVVRPQTCIEKLLSAAYEWILVDLLCMPPDKCEDDATTLLRDGSTVEFELAEHDTQAKSKP
jgi:hypothetical protein